MHAQNTRHDATLVDLADLILQIARHIEPRNVGVVPLTGTEATVMRWIHRHPGASPGSAAVATAMQKSNLSIALRSLEKKGMIERVRDDEDARLVRLHTTALARQNISRLQQEWNEKLSRALDGDWSGTAEAVETLLRIYRGLSPSSTVQLPRQ